MSRPVIDEPLLRLEPEARLRYYADLYRHTVNPAQLAWFRAHTVGLGLALNDDEATILAALDTPAAVQNFLNTQIYYNDDHGSPDAVETAQAPRTVLRTGTAHCFEGALFAYAVHVLHRHEPRFVLLEASQDPDHNLVLIQDRQTGLYAVNAHSAWPHLDGRPAEFRTVRAVAESYYPYYISDLTKDPEDNTLVGYSEPFDLVIKYGVDWIGSREPLWDIYYTYIDASVRFHFYPEDSGEPHPYSLVRAVQEHWLQMDAQGQPFVGIAALPAAAQELWHAFWRVFDPGSGEHPHGEARRLQDEFMRLTGTTPLDLQINQDELANYIARGYPVEQLMNGLRPPLS